MLGRTMSTFHGVDAGDRASFLERPLSHRFAIRKRSLRVTRRGILRTIRYDNIHDRVPVATPCVPMKSLLAAGLLPAPENAWQVLETRTRVVVTALRAARWAKVLLQSFSASGIETSILEMPTASAPNVFPP